MRKSVVVLVGLFGLTACGPFERYERNCLNEHVRPNYGSVREIPGGFEIFGSGPQYQPLEISQHGAPLAVDASRFQQIYFPTPRTRYFICKPAEDEYSNVSSVLASKAESR